MKYFKPIALSVFLALTVLCGIWSSSCSKNGCKGVTCLNFGTCSGGICRCDSGLGGVNCEVVYRQLYANTYKGNGTDDSGHQYLNNTLAFGTGTDTTNFNNITLTWTNPSGRTVVFSGAMLSNNLSSGSNFTVISTPIDTVSYSGGGSVNGNVASITLTESHLHSAPIIITLNNLNKQ